jgi:hypothetical protein
MEWLVTYLRKDDQVLIVRVSSIISLIKTLERVSDYDATLLSVKITEVSH